MDDVLRSSSHDHSLDVLKAAAKKCYYLILPKIRKKFLEKEIFAKLDSLYIWNKKKNPKILVEEKL